MFHLDDALCCLTSTTQGYPVRKKYPQAESERLTIESDEFVEVPGDDQKVDSVDELQEDVSKCSKRLLPDRSHAAHNRANEKLVHFIVRQRMVEGRLLVCQLFLCCYDNSWICKDFNNTCKWYLLEANQNLFASLTRHINHYL